MPRDVLQELRPAILEQKYAFSEHAYDEMEADGLDALDVESAILTGQIDAVLTHDPRGVRYVVIGKACDLASDVAIVVKFVECGQLLVITVYEIE